MKKNSSFRRLGPDNREENKAMSISRKPKKSRSGNENDEQAALGGVRWGECGRRSKDAFGGKELKNFQRVEGRIVNGMKARENEYPWLGSFAKKHGNGGVSYCASSLLNSRWLITAAHCCKHIDPKSGKFLKG
jgi:V8-like Glu-specific endopeptidase